MIEKVSPAKVDPKSAAPDFWKRYHAYRRIRHAERHPDDPIKPDDLERAQLLRDNPFEIEYRYEIVAGGAMVSWFRAGVMRPGTPGYESNKHIFGADWSVHPFHRRRGIGSSWLPLVVELMDRHGCTVLSFGADEEPGHAFMKWVGAEAKSAGAENRLRLSEVDWDMVRRWIDDGSKRSPQTRLEIHDGRVPDPLLEDFTAQLTSLLNTMPFDQLDHGEIVVTPDKMREWYEQMTIEHARHHVLLTREPDGVISGMTDVVWAPYRPKLLSQQFTGVRPDTRGRGLGKWLKAAMLMHARELYPGLEQVITGNAASNAPMLAINTKLGFKQFRAGTEYQMTRDRLAARVRELT